MWPNFIHVYFKVSWFQLDHTQKYASLSFEYGWSDGPEWWHTATISPELSRFLMSFLVTICGKSISRASCEMVEDFVTSFCDVPLTGRPELVTVGGQIQGSVWNNLSSREIWVRRFDGGSSSWAAGFWSENRNIYSCGFSIYQYLFTSLCCLTVPDVQTDLVSVPLKNSFKVWGGLRI